MSAVYFKDGPSLLVSLHTIVDSSKHRKTAETRVSSNRSLGQQLRGFWKLQVFPAPVDLHCATVWFGLMLQYYCDQDL